MIASRSEPHSKILYNSPPLDIHEQIELLQSKGLIITDINTAEYWLSHISYFRFKNYSYSFKDYLNADGNYIKGTRFEDVCGLYHFDRRLKIIVFEAIESIEISIKTQVSNLMSKPYGSHWYTNAGHFFSEDERLQIRRYAKYEEDIPKGFNHQKFLQDIEKELANPTEVYLQHYKKYYEPAHPPSWMLMEMITFGTMSLMFENLRPSDEKNAICENFKLTKKQLVSWLHSFSFIRNKCAHHGRLVYSKINFAPSMPQRKSRRFLAEADKVYNDTLYAVLCCIQYMLTFCNNNSGFRLNLIALTKEFPKIDYNRIGFTTNWREEGIWNSV